MRTRPHLRVSSRYKAVSFHLQSRKLLENKQIMMIRVNNPVLVVSFKCLIKLLLGQASLEIQVVGLLCLAGPQVSSFSHRLQQQEVPPLSSLVEACSVDLVLVRHQGHYLEVALYSHKVGIKLVASSVMQMVGHYSVATLLSSVDKMPSNLHQRRLMGTKRMKTVETMSHNLLMMSPLLLLMMIRLSP